MTSQFNLENELSTVLRFDAPMSRGPAPRWQRKILESSLHSANTSLNISLQNTSVNRSVSSKTPSKTPAKTPDKHKSSTPGKTNKTPKSPHGDRFIPNRSGMHFELGHYMLTQGASVDTENLSPKTAEYRNTISENLNGDLSNFRIMAYKKKAPLAPAGYSNALKVVYSSSKNVNSVKKSARYIPHAPDRILDAPDIRDDYYLNLMDWSSLNHLAIALAGQLYLWNASSGEVQQLTELKETGEYISSVSWSKEGNYLAVGTSMCDVQLWDIESMKRLRVMKSHSARVPSLSWNSYILTSASRSGQIHHHDVRIQDHHVATLTGHNQEVCGLQWSTDGKHLASGGNDNILNIWSSGINSSNSPLYSLNAHQSAVKAISWCPWQPHLLATGGGTADRCIKIWNCNLGACLNSVDTKSQICSILWSNEYKEIVSGHGFANNELIIWKYPSMNKVAELTGHVSRVLHLAMSPDETTVASAGADETLRLWKCFAVDQNKKKAEFNSIKKPTIRMDGHIR